MPGPVILVSGPPGAGKSTTSRRLAARYPRAVHLPADHFWHHISSGGIAPHLPAADAQNHTVVEVVAGAACAYADGGFTVVVDGVVGPWMLDHYRRAAAGRPGLALHYLVLRPGRAVTLARAQRRPAAEALVDEAPLLALWDQFADLGALEQHALDTTDQDPADTVRVVAAAVASGRYRL